MTTLTSSAPWVKERATYRAPALSTRGAVAAPHYLASLAGVQALQDGGSAVDAALAANLVMAVTWPHMCGPGGDLFAQVWSAKDQRLYGFNGSGRAGAAMTLDAYRQRGLHEVPERGPYAVSVPGAVDGWFALHERFGRLEPKRIFRDAIRHAREGFNASARLAGTIRANAALLGRVGAGAEIYLKGGQAPVAGDLLVQAELADTLEQISREGRAAMYGGSVGERIVAFLRQNDSLLAEPDFAAHTHTWVEPLGVDYRGVRVTQLPPNTQGLVLLQVLNMLADADVAGWGLGTAELIHQLAERKKVAFADRDHYVGDPEHVEVPVDFLLSREYARRRVTEITGRAGTPAPGGPPAEGDTIYLCAADADGNVVSLIQSNFAAFGSGVVVPGVGVVLHNRASSFRLIDGHANALSPNKRPMHTLVPGFALKDGKPFLAFGTRGADGQPQTGFQVVTHLLDFGLDPQQAVEAPRWAHGAPSAEFPRDAVVIESRFGDEVAEELRARGHQVVVTGPLDFAMGTAQVIQVDQARGCYVAASDPRGDGVALTP